MNEKARSIKILIAEDQPIVREGLRLILENEPAFEIIAQAGTGSEAIAQVQHRPPDVAILNIDMPHMNGLEAARRIKEIAPHVRVVMLTGHASVEYVIDAHRAGADGYVVKEAQKATLINAIHAVIQGDDFVCPSLPNSLIQRHLGEAQEMDEYNRYELLTPREREVFQLLAEDRTNREIAHLLDVSVKTIETHRRNLMSKLNVGSLTELVKVAIAAGVIQGNVDDSP